MKLFNENSNQFPKTKVEVFNYLVDLSIKEDKKHFVQNENISIGQIDEIKNKLIDIAFIMSLMGKNSIDRSILKNITDQDLRLSGLLYIDEDKCEFAHNNFQEYFSAIKLSKLSFEDIKEIIFFKPNYEKIKPKWINTLSFLFSILTAKQNSSVFKQLLNYVSGKEPSILIRFETDKITEDIKFTIFKTLLEDAEEKNIYLYKAGFNNYDLAKFSQMTDAIILYLFGKLDNSHSNNLKYSVLSILQYVKEINPTQIITFNKETKKILIKIIKNNSDIQLVGLAIRCISDFIKDGEEDVIDDIISNCREIKNHEIRRSLNYFLNKIKNPDKYLNFIKESIDIFEDFSRSSNNVSYSHSHDIENFLLRNTSFSFVKDVLKLLINDTELLNTYSHRRFHLSEEFLKTL
ncbi:MAG: hypothetical protein IPN93_10420 [Bacteroidetes bacterium]|nr:hypothetical protein [Bacteroidota bacterium]